MTSVVSSALGLALLTLVFGACSSALPPDLGGEPLWRAVDFSAGRDLGAAVDRVAGVGPAGEIRLVDVTEAAGLGDVVGGGNSHGVGVALVDLSGDGWPDLFIANGVSSSTRRATASRFLRNQGDGTFIDATMEAGFGALAGADLYSVAAGDYDHDGDLDLYLGAQPRDQLWQNQGDGRFLNVTAEAGAGGPESDAEAVLDGRSKVVSFGDYDNDGWLDLVSASSTLPAPFAYLLHNQGDGTFRDASLESKVQAAPVGNPCAVLFSDYDSDGDRDLWIWNDRGDHILLRNDGGRFQDATQASKLDDVTITHPMGIDAADIDHDGDLDFYVSNIGNNPLLRNNGDGTFVDITEQAGTGGDFGWGTAFVDFDADGWADLFVAQEDDLPHLVFHNEADPAAPRFRRLEVPHPPVLSPGEAHNVAAAFGDYDGDGRTDVIVAGTDGGRVTLYRNETELGGRRYLEVALTSPDGEIAAVGARVAIKTGDLVQFDDVKGGSSRASQNQPVLRFGLGDYGGAEWLVALFPKGEPRVLRNVGAGRIELSQE